MLREVARDEESHRWISNCATRKCPRGRLSPGCSRSVPRQPAAVVKHGCGVEVLGRHGFCEAVWDADFPDADFDQTDVVFGSGCRVRPNGLVCVSAASTLDRLHWHATDRVTTVSNSLACLMTEIGASVDPGHGGYGKFFESIVRGTKEYRRSLATSRGPVHLVYFDNLAWDGRNPRLEPKPCRTRSFARFDDYNAFLTSSFHAIGQNLADPSRRFPLRPLATVSTGYDSPVGAVVGRHAGLKETLSVARGRRGADDDGSAISTQLGLQPFVVERNSGLQRNDLLPLYIASDAKGEDLYFAGAADHLAGRLIITGYGGSRVWSPTAALGNECQRSDQSGLSHTEPRLHVGYLHCPVPFLGARSAVAIRDLNHLSEMEPWSLPNDYDRPICRRIIEQAGVTRSAFGQGKKAASVLLFDRRSFLPPELLHDFDAWLHDHRLNRRGLTRLRDQIVDLPRALLRSAHRLDPEGRWPVYSSLGAGRPRAKICVPRAQVQISVSMGSANRHATICHIVIGSTRHCRTKILPCLARKDR